MTNVTKIIARPRGERKLKDRPPVPDHLAALRERGREARLKALSQRAMGLVTSLPYDQWSKCGWLAMDVGECCDMDGTIGIFKEIDPEVRYIYTLQVREPDVDYHLRRDGWVAFDSPSMKVIGEMA